MENYSSSNLFFNKDELKKQGLITNGYHLPYNPDLVERARVLRKNMTEAERKLWYEFLRNFKYPVLRQRPIHHFIVDFYCAKLKLVIEVDGGQHYTEDGKAYDEERRKILESYGLREIRFRNDEVLNNFEEVCRKIEGIPPVPSLDKGESIPPVSPLGKVGSIPPESPLGKGGIKGGIKKEFEHLPIDTKYFKYLELEILSQFDDLDKSLDGWLIKSENYQALNTILPKFKENLPVGRAGVQTIYIDPPFNLDSSDQFLYRTNYKDANWATLLENRLRIAKEWLNEKGSIFVRCDYNGNWIVRCLMDEIFDRELVNEIQINTTQKVFEGVQGYNIATNSLFWYGKEHDIYISTQRVKRQDVYWLECHSGGERRPPEREFFGKILLPPKGRHWTFVQEKINKMIEEGRIRINEEKEYIDMNGKIIKGMPEYQIAEEKLLTSNWTDIPGYTSTTGFQTENSEKQLNRVIKTASKNGDFVMDFFLGSGTTTAVAHKLGRKWIVVEMGEHFYSVVLPRMKKVLAYDKSGISKEIKEYQGGGFFKYYELEQYEEVLNNCVYENHDIFIASNKSPYEQYVFLKDEKMLRALEIDYVNNKVKVDLSRVIPPVSPLDKGGIKGGIDIAETLSNLTGKWIKKITPLTPLQDGNYVVEFEDGTKVNTKELDYKLIKPLIWWE